MAQSCLTLCDPMDCRTPGFPVYHHLLEFTQTHVHWVSDAIQPSHPLSSPFLYSGSKFQVQFFAYDVQLYQHHLWKIFCIIKSSCRLCWKPFDHRYVGTFLCLQCRRQVLSLGREIPWSRKWQPTSVFLSEKSHGQRSQAGYSPWGPKSLSQLSD